MNNVSAPFSAVLLVGGKSSRMGRNKIFLEIGGVPLWQHQLQILEALEPNEIFIAGSTLPEQMATGYPIVPDAEENAGPLAGLVASFRRCTTPFLIALAVDLPNMTTNYLGRLVNSCVNGRGVVPTIADRFEPLAALYPIGGLGIAESLLSLGHHSLQEFVRLCIARGLIVEKAVRADEELLFFNVNTPAAFAAVDRN
jgi:molybdopterin-guanine dinucleotide biosynthesis protein A